jgi:DNA repair protein RadD
MNLRPYQQEAVDAVYEHLRTKDTNPCVVLPTGCHAKGHPILMYDGSVKKVEDIVVGDLVMGDDERPRTVYQILRGREEMVKVSPVYLEDTPRRERIEFIVNKSHLLSLYGHNWLPVEETGERLPWHLCVRAGDRSRHPMMALRQHIVGTGRSIYRCFETHDIGVGDYYGFNIDGNHLYLDGYGYEHHNCGKSLVLAKIASDAVTLWGGRVLVLAHVKELLEQNADKVRRLCPELKVGVYSAGLNSRDTREAVIVAGIQSVYNKACDLGRFDLVIVDECFPAGTMIDTPRGQIPIEELYVGQPVRHALGVGNIEAISSRPARELVQLELNNGRTIRCTPNHPFFTECGWCPAGSLAVGTRLYSREDVSRLREGVSTGNHCGPSGKTGQMPQRGDLAGEEILFEGLQEDRPSADAAGCRERGASVERDCKDAGQDMPVLRERIPSEILPRDAHVTDCMGTHKILLDILREEGGESDVQAGGCPEGVGHIEGDWPQAGNPRREWDISDIAAGEDCKCARGNGGDGVSSFDDQTPEGRGGVFLLQAGCGHSVSSPGDSAGRRQPPVAEDQGIGQEYETLAGGIRVVGVAHIELESPCAVYNLQVEGHPSYYADGVLVHNCHLIAPDGEGMYRTFLKDMKVINPDVRLIGLTATPFRLKGGAICKPGNLLNEVCYEAGLKEMIAQGYLSPLVSRAGHAEADLSSVHTRAGEFVQDELASAMDNEQLVDASCSEIAILTRERKSVLIFCTSVEHCKHVAEAITRHSGKECAVVTGETSAGLRAEIIARFRGEHVPTDLFGTPKPPLKYLANCSVLTTGFDAPHTDCVVLMRPTQSPGLLLQMAGRGLRLSPETGKANCLILDYGGNILRHGPLDTIRPKEQGAGGGGEAPAKKCPQCNAVIHAGYGRCPECGYEFPAQGGEGLTEHASTEGVLSGEVTRTEYEVQGVAYSPYRKRGADDGTPRTMRVDYEIGIGSYKSEWLCPEHTGYARRKFEKWWLGRCADGFPVPDTVDEAVEWANGGALAEPQAITVRTVAGEKFDRVESVELGPRPEMDDGLVKLLEREPVTESSGGLPQIDDDDLPF